MVFELCESYPRIISRIMPPNHTPKSTIVNVSFGIVWDCSGLTSFNGPDKLIDQCGPDPILPGYLHIPSRHEWWIFSTRSLIIIPKLAGSGWLAGLLGGWLIEAGWLRVWLLAVLYDEADEEDDSGCGWLAGCLPKPKIRRRGTLAYA